MSDVQAPSPCPLCATNVDAARLRCPSCGYTMAGVGGRPGPYSRAALWWTGSALLGIYLVTLAIVGLTS